MDNKVYKIDLSSIQKLLLKKGVNERISSRNINYGLVVGDYGIAYNKSLQNLIKASDIEVLTLSDTSIEMVQGKTKFSAPVSSHKTESLKEKFVDFSKLTVVSSK